MSVAPLSACPACGAASAALARAGGGGGGDLVLSVPTAHCAACITGIEAALLAHPGVRAARVNLTLRRVLVTADDTTAEALAAALTRAGFEAHALDPAQITQGPIDPVARALLTRIGVAGFAMMNVMVLSVAVWSGAVEATRALFHWISAAIALPVVVFAAQPFWRPALRALAAGRLTMDVPITVAITLAAGVSLFETLTGGREAWFDAALMLTFFLLVGRWLDHRGRVVARSAVAELAALEVPHAALLQDGAEISRPVAALRPGDLVRVRPGARFPADGEIVSGRSEIDRALITGETLPVPAMPGLRVGAGETNLTGALVLRVTAAGADSTLGRIAAMVAAAETARNRYTSLAARAARIYAPLVHLTALAAFLLWFRLGHDLRRAVEIAAAVLIVTCPCAIGLAVPAVVAAASGRLFRRGVLLGDGTALERLAEVDVAIFDKTGTLTAGIPVARDLHGLTGDTAAVALALALASSHPLATALAGALAAQGVSPAAVDDLREVPGCGVEGRIGAQAVRLGRAEWLGLAPVGGMASCLQGPDGRCHVLRFEDRLRPGAERAVAGLRAAGLAVRIVSGDAPAAVARVAAELGIADWQAGARPEDKTALVARLTAQGRHVLMLGDGLNDTAALAAAHVSIAPASGLEATRAAADIVLIGPDLGRVAAIVRLARLARRRMRQNLMLAAGYNLLAVPLAFAGAVTPLIAALAMSLSSLTVTLNALRLREPGLRPGPGPGGKG